MKIITLKMLALTLAISVFSTLNVYSQFDCFYFDGGHSKVTLTEASPSHYFNGYTYTVTSIASTYIYLKEGTSSADKINTADYELFGGPNVVFCEFTSTFTPITAWVSFGTEYTGTKVSWNAESITCSPGDAIFFTLYTTDDGYSTADPDIYENSTVEDWFADTDAVSGGWEFEFRVPVSATYGTYRFRMRPDIDSDADPFCIQELEIVVSPPTYPDLVVPSASLSPRSLHPGETTETSCLIRNDGTNTAAASVIKYYLSADGTFDGSDILLGSDNVIELAGSGGLTSENAPLTIGAGVTPGPYNLMFVIDPDNLIQEENETNNTLYGWFNVVPFPEIPTSVSAEAGNTEITLSWADNGWEQLTQYNIYRNSSLLTSQVVSSGGSKTFTDTGLTNGQSYSYYVTAVDTLDFETLASATVSVTPSNFVQEGELLITEIHYDPSISQGADTDYEFIEIYNISAAEVDLTGITVEVAGSSPVSLDGQSLASNGYMLIVQNAIAYSAAPGTKVQGVFSLPNDGAIVSIKKGAEIFDVVSYLPSAGWPIDANGTGPSLELADNLLDNDLASSWQSSCQVGGTPGIDNIIPGAPPSIGSDIHSCIGDTEIISAPAGYASYSWSDGSSTSSSMSITETDNYFVTVEDNNSCVLVSNTILATFHDLPVLNMEGDTVGCSVPLTIDPPGDFYDYLWTGGSTGATLAVSTGGVYSVQVFDQYGCMSSDEIEVILPSEFETDQICFVTVNDEGKNTIVWSNPGNRGIINYKIYRESNFAGVYGEIGEVSAYDSPFIVDDVANPEDQSYRYRINMIDTCGQELQNSKFYNTMSLSVSEVTAGENQLTWEKIEVEGELVPVATYYIFRGIDPENMTIVDTRNGNYNTYLDNSAPPWQVYYKIGVAYNLCDSPVEDFMPSYPGYAFSNLFQVGSYSSSPEISLNDTIGIFETATLNFTPPDGSTSFNTTYDFDGGNVVSSSQEVTVLSWNTTGWKYISLQIEADGHTSDITYDSIFIKVIEPEFTASAEICLDAQAIITALVPSRTDVELIWDFDGEEAFTGEDFGPLMVSWDSPGEKTISLQYKVGEFTSDPVSQSLIVNSLPEVDLGESQTICLNESIDLENLKSNPGTPIFEWDNDPLLDEISLTIIPENNEKHFLKVTTEKGCSAKDSLTISVSHPYNNEEICMASVNDAGKNVVIWETTPDVGLVQYNVYRQTEEAGHYEVIGSVLAGENGVFEDVDSNPEAHADWYKIEAIDTCGNTSDMSPFYKTMSLAVNEAAVGMNQLTWEKIEVEGDISPVSTYYIFRGIDPENMTVIDTRNGSYNAYLDNSAPPWQVFYRIGVEYNCATIFENLMPSYPGYAFSNLFQVGSYSSSPEISLNDTIGIFETATLNFTPPDGSTSINTTYDFDGGNVVSSSQEVTVLSWNTTGWKYISLQIEADGHTSDITYDSIFIKVIEPEFTASAEICLDAQAIITALVPSRTDVELIWDFDGEETMEGDGFGPLNVKWTSSGSKTVSLQFKAGAYISDPVTEIIQVYALPEIDLGDNQLICLGESITVENILTANGNPTWEWNHNPDDDDTSYTITPNEDSRIVLKLTSAEGCVASDSIEIVVAAPFNEQEICMVTVNNDGKNMIIWEPHSEVGISHFNIYKQSNVTDVYDQIGSVTSGELGAYIDEDSNPSARSDWYKMSIIDTCGNESELSPYHKTILLDVTASVLGGFNLEWDELDIESGTEEYTTYVVWRSINESPFENIVELASSHIEYRDEYPPLGNLVYQISARKPSGCNPGSNKKNSVAEDYTESFSNIEELDNTTGNKLWETGYSLRVYPNPFTTSTIIEFSNPENIPHRLIITDMAGKIVREEGVITGEKYELRRDGLEAGMYIVEMMGEKASRAIVIMR